MNTVLNVGLDPEFVGDPAASSEAFPTVDKDRVIAGITKAAAEFAQLGLSLENCLVDRGETAEAKFRSALRQKHYDFIVIGGGVRLEPSLTPLFETLVNLARTHSPASVLCFNTGPETTVEAVRRWWPRATESGSTDEV